MGPLDVRVPDALDGERVDRAVAFLTGLSRADVQALIERGEVLVEGTAVAKSRKLATGERVRVTGAPDPPELPGAEPIDLQVVDEDEHILVIDKPAGLVVHPGAGHANGTLVNALLAHDPDIGTVGDPMRPGIVHRLDRDTSGLLVVARSALAYEQLVAMLSRREVERRYLALVLGSFDTARGVIDAPIGRSARRPTRMAVRDDGRPARTGYEVLTRVADPDVTLLECTLETGRTHQIRVHCSAVGHPIVGDAAYGGARGALRPGRPFLHAARLAFDHPASGEPRAYESPLPPELARVLETIGLAVPKASPR